MNAGQLPMLPPNQLPAGRLASTGPRLGWFQTILPNWDSLPPNILQTFPNGKRILLLQMAVEMEKEMRYISANRNTQAVESISIHIFNLKKFIASSSLIYFGAPQQQLGKLSLHLVRVARCWVFQTEKVSRTKFYLH